MLWVIKKNKRYVKHIELVYSFTENIDRAAVFGLKRDAGRYQLDGETIVKVQKNKHGNLVEVY